MGHTDTQLGRAHAALDEWLEQEHLKGMFGNVGAMWGRHPSWGHDFDSPSYLDNRWAWHQNLGELLNFHGTAHVRNQNVQGVPKKRLAVALSHHDVARLEAVRVVTGGTIEAHQYTAGVARLRIEDRGAFLLIKAARMFVDQHNDALFEVLNTAGRFYSYIPEPGAQATDAQLAGQEVEETHLIPLLAYYRGLGRAPHDCAEAVLASGGGPRVSSAGLF